MAATCKFLGLIIVWACFALAARAQYLAIGGGGVFSEDLRSSGSGTFGQDQANFSKSGMLAVDAGIGFLPFITGGFHYSYARPELELRRGDAFGSSARVDLTAHTLTFDARLRTPHYADFRLYGLLGAGFSRFSLAVRQAVE
ncbi:MAG: hypothetical protein HY648_00200, partial [Acidobacteria bacterium]|nr:hypothetical protein [Acidobacteriota bacterium]